LVLRTSDGVAGDRAADRADRCAGAMAKGAADQAAGDSAKNRSFDAGIMIGAQAVRVRRLSHGDNRQSRGDQARDDDFVKHSSPSAQAGLTPLKTRYRV
jgi:hypothetical protein